MNKPGKTWEQVFLLIPHTQQRIAFVTPALLPHLLTLLPLHFAGSSIVQSFHPIGCISRVPASCREVTHRAYLEVKFLEH